MSTISVSLPADGETIDAADYNTPITTIVNEINGSLNNANIAADAAIAGTKLADSAISTVKIADSAVTTAKINNAAVTADKLSLGSSTSDTSTTESTTSTSYTGLSTAQSFSVTVGSNGLLLVGLQCHSSNSTANQYGYMSFSLSGGNTLSASDANSGTVQSYANAAWGNASLTMLLTGLTPGATTVTAQFRATANTASFKNRHIWAVPL